MRVLRLHPDRRLLLDEEPLPSPGPGEALVRVEAVGLCGSDRHWLLDGGIGDAVLDRPIVLGHEFAGTVETGPLTGSRVAVDPAVGCGRCPWCRDGLANLCPDVRFAGHGPVDGALRERLAWPEAALHPVADGIDAFEAALAEPLSVAIHAADLAVMHPGTAVGVMGCGPIGIMLVALARLAGADRVVAVDVLSHRLACAEAFGATDLVRADAEPGPSFEHDRAGGLDVVFEVAGEQAAVDAAVAAARPGGTVVLVGIPGDDRTSFRASVARRKGLALKLARRAPPDAFERAVAMVNDRTLDLGRLVTMRVPLEDATRAFDSLVRRDGVKVVVEPAG